MAGAQASLEHPANHLKVSGEDLSCPHDSLRPDACDFSRERKAVPIPNLFIIIDLSPQYNDANSYG
jgi:hypothetical protein